MKRLDGYFTVEAAMIYPIVLCVIICIIYLLFFQYDRCLMEQSAAVLAIRSCSLPVEQNAEIVSLIMYQASLDDRSYIAWDEAEVSVAVKGNDITVKKEGWMKFPFAGNFIKENIWYTDVTYRSRRIKPLVFMRTCKKIRGGK